MRSLARALAVLSAVASVHLSAQAPETSAPAAVRVAEPPGPEIIDTDAEQYNRLTVPVSIAGQGPFNFLIDTGSQATVLSLPLADRLGMTDRRPVTLVGMASRVDAQTAPLLGLALGRRVFDIERVPLVDQINIGSADGILGLDALQEQRVLLDFREKTFSVADAESLGGNRGYDIVVRARRQLGQLVITSAELDGVKVSLIVGTGAQGSVGNLALQERLRARSQGQATMTDINGVEEAGNVRIAKVVQIGRARISNIPIMFVDSPTFAAMGLGNRPAMVLGMSELRLFHRVAIDFKERKVLFDLPPDAGWHTPGTTIYSQ